MKLIRPPVIFRTIWHCGSFDRAVSRFPETEQEVERKNQPSTTEVKCRNSGIALWRVMRRPDGTPKPFIVITSNVERQPCDAFLRRCVFYHIRLDKKQLMEILKNYLGGIRRRATQISSRVLC